MRENPHPTPLPDLIPPSTNSTIVQLLFAPNPNGKRGSHNMRQVQVLHGGGVRPTADFPVPEVPDHPEGRLSRAVELLEDEAQDPSKPKKGKQPVCSQGDRRARNSQHLSHQLSPSQGTHPLLLASPRPLGLVWLCSPLALALLSSAQSCL